MAEKNCQKCGMPLEDESNACSCNEKLCRYCCECDDDCECGCKQEE